MERKLFQIQCVAIFFLLTFLSLPLFAGEVKPGAPFSLSAAWLGDKVYRPNVAHNSKHREYLVVYHWSNLLLPGTARQIHGARVSEDGKYIDNFVISDLTNGCSSPDVAYDPVNDRYLVVWMWDRNGDGSNWDLKGRFIPTAGPNPAKSSFTISEIALVDEYNPQVVYGSVQKDFLVVTNLFYHSGSLKPYIVGIRIKADGSSLPVSQGDFSFGNGTTNLVDPKVTYNPVRDEYLVVYTDAVDIYAFRVNGFTAGLTGSLIGVAGWPSTEDSPAVAFSRQKDMYVITWDANRLSGTGQVYGRFVNGDGSVGTVFRLDDDSGGVRPDFTSAVACKPSSDECLVYWITVHNDTYFTFGRQLHAGGTLENGFPYVNLNSVASWGGDEPQVSIAGGPRNYFMAFKNYSGGSAISMWGQPTLIKPFNWGLFLPSIIYNKGN